MSRDTFKIFTEEEKPYLQRILKNFIKFVFNSLTKTKLKLMTSTDVYEYVPCGCRRN